MPTTTRFNGPFIMRKLIAAAIAALLSVAAALSFASFTGPTGKFVSSGGDWW